MKNKSVTTQHLKIGYADNVALVEDALRNHFGFDDQSHVLTAVAAHIWSGICGRSSDERQWGTAEIQRALDAIQARLNRLTATLNA